MNKVFGDLTEYCYDLIYFRQYFSNYPGGMWGSVSEGIGMTPSSFNEGAVEVTAIESIHRGNYK